MFVRMCITRTQVVSLALCPELHFPQVTSTTSSYLQVTQITFLLRTARMKISRELNIPGSDKPQRRSGASTWNPNMCVFSNPYLDDHKLKKEELENGQELVTDALLV